MSFAVCAAAQQAYARHPRVAALSAGLSADAGGVRLCGQPPTMGKADTWKDEHG